jgi:GH15 family glucan-1,4-alpha-glucosidase
MNIEESNRRQFLAALSAMGVLTARSLRATEKAELSYRNYQTAIGVGDEPISIVDRFGQLKSDDANVPELANAARGGGSRNVMALLHVGDPLVPANSLEASQWLDDGYLPIVHTKLRTKSGFVLSTAFSSAARDVKADYLGFAYGKNPFQVRLLCSNSTAIKADNGVLYTPERILATFTGAGKVTISNARYNCLTPERDTRVFPSAVSWEGLPKVKAPSSVDRAFTHARTGRGSLEYAFPVEKGKTYQVFVGVGQAEWLVGDVNYFKSLTLSVDKQIRSLGLKRNGDQPFLSEFTVTASDGVVRVGCEGVNGGSLLSGIWIFDKPADSVPVSAGKMNSQALYYVACGQERMEEMIGSADLTFSSSTDGQTIWIQLPYELGPRQGAKAKAVLPSAALSSERERWRSFLDQGAQLRTGMPDLDNLYKTSLINLFLLRTKYGGAGSNRRDIYVVKPGATIYNSFWFRDGAYIIGAMDVAGYGAEAEQSLRLFTDPGLDAPLKSWGQDSAGLWASPVGEWDSQGQALWALVHHFELTGDTRWLSDHYENIRRGALWIKNALNQTKQLDAKGQRPISWGLLPKGMSEDTGSSEWTYVYEHDFWAIFGLGEAINAANHLKREDDVRWMSETQKDFGGNLLRSIKLAFATVGQGQFIPGDPFDPQLDINGDLAAVYPGRFLDPQDPMITASLDRIARHSREGLYTWFKTLNNGDMWTYMTVDWAMCCLLRGDLPMFYKLFSSYAAHASPTNAWSECIYSDSKLGTGDIPHGWAAASYILLYRNTLAYEDGDSLELCWGVPPEWLAEGAHISVNRAPTRFGMLELDLQRSGGTLSFKHKLTALPGQTKPDQLRLHIPAAVAKEVRAIRLNGVVREISPKDLVFQLI